jgi:hypothetical protein
MVSTISLLFFLIHGLRTRAQEPVPAQKMPDFAFTTLDRRDFTPASLKPGQLTFFFYFDSDCDHCQRAAGHLQEQIGGFSGVTICLVSLDPPEKMRAFLAAHAPAIGKASGVTVLRDTHDQFRWHFHPYHYPGMFLYSPQGQLLDYEDNEETVFRITGSIRRWNAGHHT